MFSCASFQIGINSTALIEGIHFNLVTFILKDGWYSGMNAFIKAGYVSLIESSDQIIEKLNQKQGEKIDINSLWAKDSLKTIEKETAKHFTI